MRTRPRTRPIAPGPVRPLRAASAAALRAVGLLTLVATGGVACGGAGAPAVDPRPLSDGGLPDRGVLEGGGGTGDGRDATQTNDGGDGGGGGGGGGGPTDGAPPDDADGRDAPDGGAGDAGDAPVAPTTVNVTIGEPVADGDLVVAGRRFAPAVTVTVTSDPTRSDDVKQTDAELWSTGAAAAKISTTRLSQLNKIDGAGDGGASDGGVPPGDDDGGATDAAPPTGAAPTTTATFTFGDTPIDLASLTTGSYELRITASTLTGIVATAKRTFRADAGPVIRVLAPVVDQASRGSVFVSVEVIDPFSATPPVVQLSVANIPITPITVVGHLYQATVAETIAMPPLSGEQLLDVGATNAAGVSARHVVVRFLFDDIGPTITNGKPATGALLGGIVKLEADVTDPAGVDPNTVVAVVAHGSNTLEVKLDRDGTDLKHFAHLFDTRRLSNTVLYPTISFRASDIPGNQSNIGYTVAVDNTPPLGDLDPPADLRMRRDGSGTWRCSWPFDPLGTDAANDGDTVLQLFDVRARVEDEGNTPAAGGADVTPIAGLDPARVELLVLDDTNRALVVDTDEDGVCDAINPKLVPTTTPMSSQDALLVNLAPVPLAGAADFTPDPNFPAAGFGDCAIGTETSHPPLLCRTSDLTVAIPARLTSVPAVWSIPNIVPSTVQCVGNQFDALGNQVKDGPACLAVHAVDRLGNSQVSRVLHVCIDHDNDGAECPFVPAASVSGGTPVQVTTSAPHGLTSGSLVLLGSVPVLFDANGLWRVTVVNGTTFTLNGSSTPAAFVGGGRYMLWPSMSDCTGAQTSINPVVVDDHDACRPWRRFNRGEHLNAN
ncbi:MAG: hypothetical protein ABUR63_08020 [Verrucomicrobiota bacterium]